MLSKKKLPYGYGALGYMCVSHERDAHKLLKTIYYWQQAHPNAVMRIVPVA